MNIQTLIHSSDVQTVYKKHSTAQRTLSSLNIFTLVSNTYYKEDFHSDVLVALLKEDSYLFSRFIDLLNSQDKKSNNIDINNYKKESLLIEREKGKIDILIRDKASKHAIIIENKINNAVDQFKQLPRYYYYVVSELGYTVDAIVYLSFDGVKHPTTHHWNEEDKKNVLKLLIKLSAYEGDDKKSGLYYWLLDYSQTGKTELTYLTKQYSDLLRQLAQKYNKEFSAMNEFYKILTNEYDNYNSYEVVQEITKMYEKLPAFYAKKTQSYFSTKHEPFESARIHKENTMFFDKFFLGSSNYAIDIILFDKKIVIKLFDRDDGNEIENLIEDLGFDLIKSSSEPNRFIKTFKFPEEESEVYPFIEGILAKLARKKEESC